MSRVRSLLWNVLVNGCAAGSWFPERLKPMVMRALGADLGKVGIRRRVDFYGPNLRIGDGAFINVGTQIQNYATVTIGTNVQIGPRVVILTVDHEVGEAEKRAVDLVARPVTVGDGCWIAASVTILPGVTVGPGCIVAAGAVVTKDCEPNGLYAGVPAKRVRDVVASATTQPAPR
ncbi:MAG: acyltransferase [Mycobacteriaceae bacterium]